jgi:hypothetical protein
VTRDGRFGFKRPDGSVIETADVPVEPYAVEGTHEVLGLRMDAKTITSRWAGETCDYGVAIDHLLRKNARAQGGSAERV